MALTRRIALTTVTLWLLPVIARAQSLQIDLGGGAVNQGGVTARIVQITALITLLSLAPSLLVMVTAFTRIIIVLSLLRSALGTQGTPPNPVLTGLALFLTLFVMQPALQQSWQDGIGPMLRNDISQAEGLRLAAEPFRHFMTVNARGADLGLFATLADAPGTPAATTPDGAALPWRVLIPAFMVGEMRRAFEMGFLLYMPFLVIDLIVASLLMSLGMMMLPPNAVSLPFKLIFFVLADGWHMIAGSLVQSFAG
jgi:flagellar biosynthetic protein FliP